MSNDTFTNHTNLSYVKCKKKALQCDQCVKSFHTWNSRRQHISTEHQEEWNCIHCKESFPSQNSLACHNIIHVIEQPYSCETCGMIFESSKHLMEHVCDIKVECFKISDDEDDQTDRVADPAIVEEELVLPCLVKEEETTDLIKLEGT